MGSQSYSRNDALNSETDSSGGATSSHQTTSVAKAGLGREFCLWMVGGQRGRVRKLRFTLRTLLVLLAAGLLVGSGFVFVASDYARVQIQRAEGYFRLKRALQQNRHLEGTAQSLHSAVVDLQSAQKRSVSYEEQIRARLDELSLLLDSSDPGRLLRPALGTSKGAGAKSVSKRVESQAKKPSVLNQSAAASLAGVNEEEGDGIGGAEVDCSSLEGARDVSCTGTSAMVGAPPTSSSRGEPRASLDVSRFEAPAQKSSLRTVSASERDRFFQFPSSSSDESAALIGLFDQYIDTLRVTPMGLPAPGYISSGYGFRMSPFHGGPSMHEGIDFSLPQGSVIQATADGVIERVVRNKTYGLVVDVRHSNRVVTRYAHLSKAMVSEGERICRGEVLGLVGSTGRSTAPHLHYEVRVDGRSKNPLPFMRLALDLKDALDNEELV